MGKRVARLFAGGLALGLVLALALSVSGLLVPASQRAALGASITATLISGEASVLRAGGFEALPDGAILRAGDTVRTGPETRLVLTYFEGSTVEIEPSSELTIDEAAFGDDGATLIRMTQLAGRTWHVVTKLLRSGSRYEVRTPTSTATVRGTQFEVDVKPSGETRVATSEGAVATSDASGSVEVIVTAGLETSVKAGESPAPPVPTPEPARRVSVQLDSVNSTVVDALGRANGVKDGKVVIQTPGAKVERGARGIVVILPDPPEGRVAVVERERPEIRVVTTIKARGADAVKTETTVRRSVAPAAVAHVPAAVPTTPTAGAAAAPRAARSDVRPAAGAGGAGQLAVTDASPVDTGSSPFGAKADAPRSDAARAADAVKAADGAKGLDGATRSGGAAKAPDGSASGSVGATKTDGQVAGVGAAGSAAVQTAAKAEATIHAGAVPSGSAADSRTVALTAGGTASGDGASARKADVARAGRDPGSVKDAAKGGSEQRAAPGPPAVAASVDAGPVASVPAADSVARPAAPAAVDSIVAAPAAPAHDAVVAPPAARSERAVAPAPAGPAERVAVPVPPAQERSAAVESVAKAVERLVAAARDVVEKAAHDRAELVRERAERVRAEPRERGRD